MEPELGRLRFLRQSNGRPRRHLSRGVSILPSLFTLANMFCGYACIVYAMRGDYETAAPFIGLSRPVSVQPSLELPGPLLWLTVPKFEQHDAMPSCDLPDLLVVPPHRIG